ncbi:DUF2796 domain-containing protein [Colwellia sp. UCD-KL20]|uniref:ZrgA family zinc uptake protein n=1 Tax=Colwellia sp. UCD-KL20 TaxID=1917165 RepID=UPI000970B9D0|nr:DUF2796 domain-containing protein [Colwellia sp. UCD-KL20]
MKVKDTALYCIHTLLVSFILLSQLSHARTEHSEHKHNVSLNSHVHGLSEITVAIDGEILDIHFLSPAINLMGFEHKASNPKEFELVREAKDTLSNNQSIFTFVGAVCAPIKADINVDALINSHEGKEAHGSHDDHSQVEASYRYQCKDIDDLSAISVDIFKHFIGIKKIKAMWINNFNQGVATLNSENIRINLD